MSKQLSMLEILNETIAFYSEDTNRRAVENGSCLYNTSDGRHCAVGRCFTDEAKGQGCGFGVNISASGLHDFESLIQEQYRGHNISFWGALQRFHDNDDNWGVNGLTEFGVKSIEIFKNKFGIVE